MNFRLTAYDAIMTTGPTARRRQPSVAGKLLVTLSLGALSGFESRQVPNMV